MYPHFSEVAKEEGFNDVAAAFTMIAKVEKEHEERYLKLADNIEKDLVFKKDAGSIWKCQKMWICT